MTKEDLEKQLKDLTKNLKGTKKTSLDTLNTMVTPQIEAQLPQDVQNILRKSRGVFDLKGTTVSAKLAEVNSLMKDIEGTTKFYANK